MFSLELTVLQQYIDMIRVFSKICKAERWVYNTYYGGKSFEARAKAIQTFADNPDIKIFIASTKAGGSEFSSRQTCIAAELT